MTASVKFRSVGVDQPTATDGPRVRITLLGPTGVTVDGESVRLTGPTQRRLIVALALALARDTRTEISDLTGEVYGDDRPPRPRRSLATLVWRLRRDWGEGVIESDRYHYWLDPSLVTVDVAAFERAATRAGETARHTESDDESVAALREALTHWRQGGTGGSDLPEAEQRRLGDLHAGLAEHLAGLLAARGDHHGAIDLALPIVTAHPDWEHSQAILVTARAALGDVDGAAQAYDAARRALAGEGVEPGPELTEAIARATGSLRGDAPAGASQARAADQAREPISAAAGAPTSIPDTLGNAPTDSSPDAPEGTPAAALATGDAGPLVGRADERALLVDTALTALDSGGSAVVLVHGEAGIGKSALVQAAVVDIRERRAARVVLLSCDRRTTLPYGPLRTLVDDVADSALAPLIPATAGAGIDSSRDIHDALRHDIASLAADVGLVLVAEDLHWAPHATIEALAAAVTNSPGRLVVIATTRDPAPDTSRGTAFDDTAPDGTGRDAPTLSSLADRHITLTGLGTDDAARLAEIDPAGSQAADVHRLTGGNPLYVQQLLRAGLTGVADVPRGRLPGDLATAIEAHLARIPAATIDVLAIAAAIGDRFDLLTLAALDGDLRRSPLDWQRHLADALRHGLIRPDGDQGGYRFVHTLIAHHLASHLTADRRTAIHAAIFAALHRISLSHPSPPDILAHHATRGWPALSTNDTVDALIAAARASGAQLDFARAVTYYRAALDHLAMDPAASTDAATATILGAAAGASAAADDLAGAAELYTAEQSVGERAGLTRHRLFAGIGLLRLAFLRRSHPRVADRLAAALTEIARTGSAGDATPALLGDALAAVSVYRPQRARDILTLFASRTGSTTHDDRATTLSLAVWEHLTVPAQVDSARDLALRTRAEATPGPATAQTRALRVAAWLRLWVAEVAAGLRRFDDPPPRDFGLGDADDQTAFDLAQWRIAREMTAGRLDRARILIGDALAGPRHPDPAERARRAASFYGQGLFLALLARQPAAIAGSPIVTNPTWVTRHPMMRYIRTSLAIRAADIVAGPGHDVARSAALVDELIDELADGDIPDSDIAPRLILTAEACRATAHRRGLEFCRTALSAHRGEHGIFRFGQYWGSVDQSLGDVLATLGDHEAAAQTYRAAIDGLTAVHAAVHLPSARRGLAEALAARGRAADRAEIEELTHVADEADRAMGLLQRAER